MTSDPTENVEPDSLALEVTPIDSEGGDMGSFWLFLNGDRGWIHLIEGPCFTARDPLTTETSDAAIEFQDEAGFTHHIPLHDTVSREQGFAAIRHWMPHGDRLSGLQWFDEERDSA